MLPNISTFKIISPSAALRRQPNARASLDTEALLGEYAEFLEKEENGWSYVRLLRDGYIGWIFQHSLVKSPVVKHTHKVRRRQSFIYAEKDIKTPPIGFLSLGCEVSVLSQDKQKGFSNVSLEPFYSNLPKERVENSYLSVQEKYIWSEDIWEITEKEKDFVKVAENFLGTPYLWGGKTSLGIDCSGLVQVSLAAIGISSPRDSQFIEKEIGNPVSWDSELSNLHRGDLVFWRGHVGIMLNPITLLHANAAHMRVTSETLQEVRLKILRAQDQDIASIKRL